MAENDTTTGATPGTGATPVQAGPATTAPAEPTPATGEDDLGEAGKKVLRELRSAERDAQRRAEAAEKELADLRSATQTDGEKALAQARRPPARRHRDVHPRVDRPRPDPLRDDRGQCVRIQRGAGPPGRRVPGR